MNNKHFVKKPGDSRLWDVVIIGSGPAALTAAIYTTRGAASTLIIGGESWGGQLMLTTTVENFPGFPDGIEGPDLIKTMRKQAEKFGTQFLEKNIKKVVFSKHPFILTDGSDEKHFARSVIIATGALTKWLQVPGEKELVGRGVATCAPCDAPFYKGKTVAVVGGGDSAMEEASVLTKYANKVYLIHRRGEFKASEIMQRKVLQNKKIEIIWNTEVKEILGRNKVDGVIIKNIITGKEDKLSLDGVFVAVGHKPDSDIFKGLLKMDDKGFIKNDYDKYHSATSVSGVFVAGDVMDYQYKQAITAAGMGCMAGMDVLAYLESETIK